MMAVTESAVVDIQGNVQERMLSFTKEELDTIRKTVAQGANDDEFRMFMHLARTYGLDPFNKEIWFIKYDNKKPTIMTSRDGYLKIANRHVSYEGIVSDVIRKNDKFIKKMTTVEHQYGTSRGNIVGAYALVYRNDRKYPAYAYAPMEEYNAHTKVWNNYPSAMILKVAESMALKRAFSVSGLVTREEMDVINSNPDDKGDTPKDIIQDESMDSETIDIEVNNTAPILSDREKEVKNIINANQKLKKDLLSFLSYARQENGLDKTYHISVDDLTDSQYAELKEVLLKFREIDEDKKTA